MGKLLFGSVGSQEAAFMQCKVVHVFFMCFTLPYLLPYLTLYLTLPYTLPYTLLYLIPYVTLYLTLPYTLPYTLYLTLYLTFIVSANSSLAPFARPQSHHQQQNLEYSCHKLLTLYSCTASLTIHANTN